MTNDERLQLLGALLVKSVNHRDELPEPLRTLIEDAREAMTKEQNEAQFKLFDESGIAGFTYDLYANVAETTLGAILDSLQSGKGHLYELAVDAEEEDETQAEPSTEETTD